MSCPMFEAWRSPKPRCQRTAVMVRALSMSSPGLCGRGRCRVRRCDFGSTPRPAAAVMTACLKELSLRRSRCHEAAVQGGAESSVWRRPLVARREMPRSRRDAPVARNKEGLHLPLAPSAPPRRGERLGKYTLRARVGVGYLRKHREDGATELVTSDWWSGGAKEAVSAHVVAVEGAGEDDAKRIRETLAYRADAQETPARDVLAIGGGVRFAAR